MVDGGIYEGPYGEKLYGSGRQVESLSDLEARAKRLRVFWCQNCSRVEVNRESGICDACLELVKRGSSQLCQGIGAKEMEGPKNIIEYVGSLEGRLRAYERHDRKLFWGGFAWGMVATAVLATVLSVLVGYRVL